MQTHLAHPVENLSDEVTMQDATTRVAYEDLSHDSSWHGRSRQDLLAQYGTIFG